MLSRKKLNILYINYYALDEGGFPLSTSFLINSIKGKGHAVSIFSRGRYHNIQTFKMIDIRKIPFFFLRDLYLKRRLKKIIKEKNIDILHCADCRFSIAASILVVQECGIPVVLHFRDYWFNCLKGDLIDGNRNLCSGIALWKCLKCKKYKRFFWELYKFRYFNERKKLINQADAIIAVSLFVKEQLKSAGIKKRVNVVNNPLPEIFPVNYRNKSDKKVVLYIGSLFKHKGIEVVLKVAKILSRAENNVKFLIVEDGAEYKNSKKYILDNNLNNVELTGYVDREQVSAIYGRTDIVFLPSLCFDTFSRSVIESLRFSKAVVASNMGGNKEIIQDGVNGFLVDPYDIEGCANLIQKLIVDDQLRERISFYAYQRSLDFSIENISEKVMSIYNDVASEKNAE